MTQDVEMKDEEALPQAPLPSNSASILQREHQTLSLNLNLRFCSKF